MARLHYGQTGALRSFTERTSTSTRRIAWKQLYALAHLLFSPLTKFNDVTVFE